MKEAESEFRRWLVDRVKHTRWVRRTDEPLEAVARRLGVQPEVIEEAQASLDAERGKRGAVAIEVGTAHRRLPRQRIEIAMPQEVHGDWKQLCELRRLTSAALLRSLIWTLLSGPAQPQWLEQGWRYRGRVLRYENWPAKGKWPYFAQTYITHGAGRALAMRASASRTTVTALVRGQVLELLEGRLKRVHVIGSVNAMWDDESRYWTLKEKQT